MRAALLVVAVILAACTSGSGEQEPPPPAKRIAILGDDGNISTFDPTTGEIAAITDDAGPSRLYSQPTWSPDGNRLAFVASGSTISGPGQEATSGPARVGLEAQDISSAIHIAPGEGGAPTIITTPFPAFYLYWAPDGRRLAFLGNDLSTLRQGLAMIDTTDNSVERIDIGQPYYFAWSPESDRLLVHAANRELYFLGVDGSKETVGPTPGGFSAPNWAGGTWLFPVEENGKQILRLYGTDGIGRRDATDYATAIALELNPDEERVAYIDIIPSANPFGLGPLVVDAPDGATEVAELATAFFWSADGARLLYLAPDVSSEDFALRWNVWDGTATTEFERFLPTPTFVQAYLPFFGQYANSHSFFSPDGSSFTFAGSIEGRGDGIWVQDVEGGSPAQLIAPGRFSTWAP